LKKLYRDLLSLGSDLLRAIALYLGQPEDYFDEKVRYGNSVLRPIHYPALTGREEANAVRSAAHEDINLITLLIGASSPGLEVKSRKGEWIPIVTGPTEIVVNVGDMLQRLTNYKLVSTTHRVVNPPRQLSGSQATRFSVPFFLHPVSDMSLAPLLSCVDSQNPPRDPSTTAGEYLTERLREIGLI
jgi:isopenicillin N synthase-like dioxygenase